MPSDKKTTFPLNRAEIILIALTAIYAVAGFITATAFGAADKFNAFLYVDSAGLCSVAFLLGYIVYRIVRLYYIFIFVRPKKLAAYLKQDFLDGPLNKERYIRAVPLFCAFIVLFSVFTSLKSMIPDITPFAWDPFWADADKAVHFGHDPWRLLHPIFGHPAVTKAVNWIYNYWLFIKYFVLYWMLFSIKKPLLRMQFFYAYALTWIINGSILAILFASAGPCFYEAVTGVDRFGELMTYLAGVSPDAPIPAVSTQAMLWQEHASGALAFGSGISAMPSLHVATAFLFMLLGLNSHWFWKIVGTLFYLSILIGSVHLGWHYALDGYIATLTTLPLWFFSGWFVKKIQNNRHCEEAKPTKQSRTV